MDLLSILIKILFTQFFQTEQAYSVPACQTLDVQQLEGCLVSDQYQVMRFCSKPDSTIK